MLHAKLLTSVEEDFKGFTICRRGGHLGQLTRIIDTTFRPLSHAGTTCSLASCGKLGLKEIFEMDGRTHDDNGRMPEDDNTLSLPCETNGSGELNWLSRKQNFCLLLC